MKTQGQERQFAALKNLADISCKLGALGWHEMADRVAEQIDPLAERAGIDAEALFFGAPK